MVCFIETVQIRVLPQEQTMQSTEDPDLGGLGCALSGLGLRSLNHHIMDIKQIILFLDYGNLIQIPQQQPSYWSWLRQPYLLCLGFRNPHNHDCCRHLLFQRLNYGHHYTWATALQV